MVSRILNATVIGIISGIVLGAVLKVIEEQTTKKVYTLLLNIDFIPILNSIQFGEMGEFLFHLLFSIILSFIYMSWTEKSSPNSALAYFVKASIVTFPTILLYFPLSFLALKEVPAINDIQSIMFWTFGHFMYVIALSVLVYLQQKKPRS
ncbi:hypothetical protein ACFYKX_24280 [Cytobacillus sp. FJAT-54145]|uniref:DUF1440 domain-containing protein n=1 Tax=Cytobacillus spartinae TaxID=3299023 RepID=A0ABW6KHG1_9BACI